ncbi:hypothetical protein J2W25_006745 [Variovorax boronicumulans]|uniref:Uncharacterized protein n=1 Tax=Variovorax boronicumulans TaxID=436515 RepID=A0AAW8E8S2_9BURK|nr:hypothetical protein [Variovorax boronicumulans]MDP9927691.1 hypothetical protein [Variovorax boronicumulans]
MNLGDLFFQPFFFLVEFIEAFILHGIHGKFLSRSSC